MCLGGIIVFKYLFGGRSLLQKSMSLPTSTKYCSAMCFGISYFNQELEQVISTSEFSPVMACIVLELYVRVVVVVLVAYNENDLF